jgi:hypothetical protein
MTEIGTKLNENELSVNGKDAIAVINRWHGEIYPGSRDRSSALLLAYLVDPLISDISASWKEMTEGKSSVDEEVKAINLWTTSNLTYTQIEPVFSHLPGKDPWGTFTDSQQPVFKKLIPPEMVAMKNRTGKISGKCFTLVNFTISTLMKFGVDPDNIISLIVKSGNARHAMALVKYKGQVLLINLNMVGILNDFIQKDFKAYEILGVYSLYFAQPVNVILSRTDIMAIIDYKNITLSDAFFKHYGLSKGSQTLNGPGYESIETGYTKSVKNPKYKYLIELTKYAYQSLKVGEPNYYLDASLMSSLPKQLARNFSSPDEVFEWIESHIRYGSIFPDPQSRIMTADQVLVFQQGSYKDQAVLAYTLLQHMGIETEIVLTKDNAYIKLSDKYYNFDSGNYHKDLKGDQLLIL